MTENNNPPIIEFSNVAKRFGHLTVLDDFNFIVRKGEKVTLIGPSGSGKSSETRRGGSLGWLWHDSWWHATRPSRAGDGTTSTHLGIGW